MHQYFSQKFTRSYIKNRNIHRGQEDKFDLILLMNLLKEIVKLSIFPLGINISEKCSIIHNYVLLTMSYSSQGISQ